MRRLMDAQELQALSRLFSYPDSFPEKSDLDRLRASLGRQFSEVDLMSMQSEYVRLFINALSEVPCPPYGSVYLESCLMGESTVRLLRLYQGYGFTTEEMADHIAVELEFIALLTQLDTQTPLTYIEADRNFIYEHLQSWTSPFLYQVCENDRIGFYKDVSRHAHSVIARLVREG